MTDVRLPRLLDSSLNEIVRLHPLKLSINESLSPLSTAEMTLPPQMQEGAVGDFVELYDAADSAGIYRIAAVENVVGGSASRRLTLEHAACTLGDSVLFGYHAFDGASYETAAVVKDLLAWQTTAYWQLGQCEVSEQLSYTFENGSLLDALLAVIEPLSTPCMLTFDFTTFPWTMHLRRLSDVPACECRLNRNLESLAVTIDRTDLCTRIYPLGYGEGADQLTIRDVNSGIPYLDADTQSTWGVVERAYADTTITAPETLLAAAQAMLQQVKTPVVTVEVTAAELHRLTGEELDRFTLGALCRVPVQGSVLDERIISLRRPDVYGDPSDVRLTLANRSVTASGDLASLTRKAFVSQVYSQGAASEYAIHFGDNADSSHPASLRFYIDEDALHVNKAMVRYELAPFRGYTKASSGGGKSDVSVKWNSGSLLEVTSSCSYTTAVTGEPHTHDVETEVDLPSFSVSVPSHTHGINLGIYEGSTASAVSIQVDGTAVPASTISGGEFDAVNYLAKDSRGRVRRGAWHEITFTPNSESRVVADLHVRTFIRTLTGANL